MVLTSVKIYDKELDFEKSINNTGLIELSYKDKFVSFEFAALDFTNPQKNNYAYMMEGFDENWIFSGNRRYANYTNLNGGKYVFKIKGSNNDGLWNEEGLSIKLNVTPPIWQTWWFKFILVLLILSMIYLLITLRMRSINKQKRKLELEVAQRTRELNQSNYELLRAKRDTDDILNNVEEGIFLLNSNFEIGLQYSLSLEKMLLEEKISGQNLLQLLHKKLEGGIIKSTEEYLNLMFSEDVDEESLKELNPLSEVELNIFDDEKAWLGSKFLSFNFKRINEDSKIQNLIATVIDVTEQVVLAQKLKISEEKTHHQVEWMVNILQIEPALLNEFLESAQSELKYVDSLLKHSGDNGNFHHILEEIYRSIHLIKGNATLLDIKFFVDLAHDFEEKLVVLKRQKLINGKDFVPLVVHLGDMRQSLNEIEKLIEKMSNFHHHMNATKRADADILLKSIKNLLQNLSVELGKEVELDLNKFNLESFPSKFRLLLKDVLIQLIRNSFIHGIESPEERLRIKKKTIALISLSSNVNTDNFILKFRDDGRGIQTTKLRKKALELKRYSKQELDMMNSQQIANLIFESDFTTENSVNVFAGRGIGLNSIREKLHKVGGNIQVEFRKGFYTEFTICFPLKSKSKRTAKKYRKTVINI
jgi:HPt (histidine-containing phosphotransfer) domain-containing protein